MACAQLVAAHVFPLAMLLHLTRHAQPGPWAAAVSDDGGLLGGDPALTDVGAQQARLLGQYLRKLGFAGRIWSSPYRRSAQTADLLADELGLRFGVTPALRDIVKDETPRRHLPGKTLQGLRAAYPRLSEHAALEHPWWSDATDDRALFTCRIIDWLTPLLAEGRDLVAVGHGATVNQLTQVFTARAGRNDLGTWFGAWNAQLTTFQIDGGRVTLVRLADVSFLPRELVTANDARLIDGHDAGTGAAAWSAT